MQEIFRRWAHSISNFTGTAWAFFGALTVLATWAVCGPLLGFSNTWQLAINTFTTIVTFLMVFLIQNTQNRDNKALHLKIDELLRVMKGTHPKLLDTDKFSDQELEEMHQGYVQIAEKYQSAIEKRIIREKKKDKTN